MSTTLPIFQVDAFTRRIFSGNPAAVVPMDGQFPHPEVMQQIASENNLSETAFFTRHSPELDGADFHLRWFTPTIEVNLCGHATLAAAHVLLEHLGHDRPSITFASRAGALDVTRQPSGMLRLNFPAAEITSVPISDQVIRALGRCPTELYDGPKFMAVYENKRDVHELEPDIRAIRTLGKNIIVTAPGVGHDFVSRYFAPMSGVDEDPVTGSAHCLLAPYWSRRLGKQGLTAHQISKRGGELACEMLDGGSRVGISGYAVTYLEGTIRVPAVASARAAV